VAFVGDRGFSMGMAEFATCIKYRLPVKVVLLKCNTYGLAPDDEDSGISRESSGDLQPIDFASFARACGGSGITVKHPSECGAALDEALELPGPVLVEVLVDPKEAPVSPRPPSNQAE
jgi:pyruvate dehydrogenase (quinone)